MTALVRKAIRNVADLLTKEQTEILKTATLLMIPSLLSKLLGNAYFILVSTQLGNGIEILDFNTANAIPEMLTNILLLGIVSAVVIPIFIEAKEHKGTERFIQVFNTMMTIVMATFLVVSVALMFFGSDLLHIFTNLDNYPGDVNRVLDMMRFLMIPNFILGISMFVASGLNVYHRIIVPQLAPLLFNVGKIFAVLILLPLMDYSPWALVVGILIGAVLHLTIQLPLVRMLGIRFEPSLDLSDEYVQKIFTLAVPRGIAFAGEQFALLFSKSLVSGVALLREAGGQVITVTGLTVFNYANALALVIPSLFGYSFAVASFPTISKLYANEKYEDVAEIVVKTLNQMFFLAVPFVIATVILRLPIVRLTFGLLPNTAFGREDTKLVGWVLLFLALGLLFTSGKWYLYRLFYAAKNTVTPLVVSLIALAITVVTAVLFTNLFSNASDLSLSAIDWFNLDHWLNRGSAEAAVGGASLGITIGTIFEFFALTVLVDSKVVKLNFKALFEGLAKKAIPTISMTILMYLMFKTWDFLSFPIDATPGFDGSTTVNLIILTSLTVGTSFMVYYLLCYLFQVEELRMMRKILNPIFKLGGLKIS